MQIKQIKDNVSLAVRKCKAGEMTITVGDLLSPGFVERLTMQNDGYRVLRTLRGSPPYWESAKRDVFAMIRQLGIPTWFCSFSAAETKWEPLLKSLAKLVQGKDLSSEEIASMSWQEKCILIKSDPVTCARYFEFRVQSFIKHVLKHPDEPIGKIIDFFYRVEFQQRGSPHIHMIIWIQNAPVHGISPDEDVASFVDKYVTCSTDETIPNLVNYQTHRHAKTCRKHGKATCRFNFPIPPLPETTVLHPLEGPDKGLLLQQYEELTTSLNDSHEIEKEMPFRDFLTQLGIDYETYIKIIQSTLVRPKVFLKRSVNECRVNNYNSVLLKCWKANMDIQYVLDPYSYVSYIVSYIAKGQRGLSNLLQEACEEARERDSDVRQQVRRIGNQFLSSVEIDAQEAVYLVLQLPLRRCTRDVIYVDTKRPNERTSLIKPISELKQLPAKSKQVEMDNILKRYKRRPSVLEQLCYADFASWYDLCRLPNKVSVDISKAQELPETEYEHDKDDELDGIVENIHDDRIVYFACGTQVKRRLRQKVIYSHITPMNHDSEEHFREKVMLYTHWRDDELDLKGEFESYEESYHAKSREINSNKFHYVKTEDTFYDNITGNIEEGQLHARIHPEAHQLDLIDADEPPTQAAEFGCFDPGLVANDHNDYDIGGDLEISRSHIHVCDVRLPQREMDNDQYLQSVRVLNQEQKRFFYHILNKVKTKSLPFFTFLSGGAGCGKSVLIRAISQALIKYFNHLHDENPDTLKLLLCAPTGKAAHNIGGSTIHSAFCIPANHGFHFKPLDMQQLNTLRAYFNDLKVIIIDEISMVGRSMFNFINLRLQEIKGCTKPFGDISILAVGDLFQLKPVLDSWIFSMEYKTSQLQSLGTNLWVDLFEFFELKEIMRQKGDRAFALLLNRLREGNHTEEDLAVLEKRQILNPSSMTEDLKQLAHLFCRRADAYAHNETVLSHMSVQTKLT